MLSFTAGVFDTKLSKFVSQNQYHLAASIASAAQPLFSCFRLCLVLSIARPSPWMSLKMIIVTVATAMKTWRYTIPTQCNSSQRKGRPNLLFIDYLIPNPTVLLSLHISAQSRKPFSRANYTFNSGVPRNMSWRHPLFIAGVDFGSDQNPAIPFPNTFRLRTVESR